MSRGKGSFITRLATVVAAAALLAVLAAGCDAIISRDNEDDKNGGGVDRAFMICGTGEAWQSGDVGLVLRSDGVLQVFSFCQNDDGTNNYKRARHPNPGAEGTWSMNGNQMTLKQYGEVVGVWIIERFSNNQVIMTNNNKNETELLTKRTGITMVNNCN
jgi:hypothetical protein